MIDDQGDVHFYLNDHLGSARRVIAENGYMQEQYTYWAFGESRSESIAKNQAYRYTGKPFDDNEDLDLYYYGARYYDPVTGRFLAVDPASLKYPSYNPYGYVLNNPLRLIDPNGKWTEDVHNKILQAAFAGMDTELKIFQIASAESDGLLNQLPGKAYRHAMRDIGQTVAEAEEKFNTFVDDGIQKFINGDAGLNALGEVFHALMDQTSPSHAGFQLWNPIDNNIIYKFFFHAKLEDDAMATEELISKIAAKLRGIYDDAIKKRSEYNSKVKKFKAKSEENQKKENSRRRYRTDEGNSGH